MVTRLLGFLCSPNKVLRFPVQDTCCQTYGSKLRWNNFAFCSFWGRSHPIHSVDQTDTLCPLWTVAGLPGDYFGNLKASGKEYLCREQEWWGKGSDELSPGGPHIAAVGDAAEPGWSSHLQSGALHVFIFFMTDFLLGMNHFSVVWPTERNQRSSFFFC